MSIFSKVAKSKIKSSVFNLSEEHKLSCNFGQLIPIMCKEVLPSDKFRISTELLIKLAPLKAPMMHKVTAYVHYFFVPTYQVNKKFESFINPKVNNNNSIVLPYITPYDLKVHSLPAGSQRSELVGTLADYLGLPVTQENWLDVTGENFNYGDILSIEPFRVYQHIYNSYYRDQNLENSGLFNIDSHRDEVGDISDWASSTEIEDLLRLRTRAWKKDYFTSALPTPQAGDDVLIPMNGRVDADGFLKLQNKDSVFPYAIDDEVSLQGLVFDDGSDTSDPPETSRTMYLEDKEGNRLNYAGGLKTVNASASINDLRRAMALQRFKELAERGGTRYSEMVANFFGARLKDYWVDRPIFLGGQVQPITVSEVLQNSATDTVTISGQSAVSPLGLRGGVGNSYGKTKEIYLNAPCHGYIMGILSIRPEAVYTQGVDRMWCRRSIFDFAFPQFARMGEQEIRAGEIFASDPYYDEGVETWNMSNVFGFTPRYAEYKVGKNYVAGAFRSSLDYWHLARKFDTPPTLSKPFVMIDNPSYASFNVTDANTEHCYVDLYNKVFARRPLPYFGTPSII